MGWSTQRLSGSLASSFRGESKSIHRFQCRPHAPHWPYATPYGSRLLLRRRRSRGFIHRTLTERGDSCVGHIMATPHNGKQPSVDGARAWDRGARAVHGTAKFGGAIHPTTYAARPT